MKSKNAERPYEHRCDYCDGGWVRCEIKAHELVPLAKGKYVVLERVPVGICDRCKAHYYHASVLKQAQALLRGKPRRKVVVPIARYVKRPARSAR